MAKKKAAKKETKEKGEQLDLIDVSAANAKPIIKVAREYVKHRDARIAVGKKEAEYKHRVIALVEAAELQPLEGGKIKFKYDGLTILVAPKEMELKVKDEKAEE